MRRDIIQFVSIVAIAVGAGLFAFSRQLAPPVDAKNPAASAMAFNASQGDRHATSVACGFGVCFMTFGVLALVIPWINTAMERQRERGGTQAP
jgi:hypothetical protein